MIDLDALIQDAYDLEPPPTSASRLASLVSQEEVDFAEVVQLVSYEPLLTAKVLRVANSVKSGSLYPISTLDQAVLRMGTGVLMSLALGGHCRSLMSQPLKELGLAEDALWRHSVTTAVAAEVLGDRSKVRVPPEAFTAALLHDIGKVALCRFLSPEVLELLHRAVSSGASQRDAENEILGVQHGEVGALIAQHWKLPDAIVQGIRCHHDPQDVAENGQVKTLCQLVSLADTMARNIEGEPGDIEFAIKDEVEDEARKSLELSIEELAGCYKGLQERLSEVLSWFE